MDIILTSFSTLIKSGMWVPILAGSFALGLYLLIFLAFRKTYGSLDRSHNGVIKGPTVDSYEIERLLKRQTDILERDRWDNIAGRDN